MYKRKYKHQNAELTYRNDEWLREEFVNKNRSIKDIAKECGISHTSLEKYLKKYNIRKRPRAEDVVLPTKEELIYLHHSEHLGIRAIAALYPNIGVGTIVRLFSEYNIERIDGNVLLKEWWSKEENKQKMSTIRMKFWEDDTYRERNLARLRDKDGIYLRAKKFSAKYQNVTENEWPGFLTPVQTRIRGSAEYVAWRKAVFERDEYTCQCCGDRSCSGHPVELHAHHLENFAHNEDLRFDVNNGITLCYNCHDIRAGGSFHNLYGVHNNTRAQFIEYIKSKQHYCTKYENKKADL